MSGDDGEINGRYDEYGDPCISFHLHGVAHGRPGPEYEGTIDTGFSGFILLPFDKACELQLPLEGTTEVILADGSSQIVLTVLGVATLGNKRVPGTVQLSHSPEILIGMEFLRKFEYGLRLFKDSVSLIPDRN